VNFTVETQSVTFTAGSFQNNVTFSPAHDNIPNVTVTLENSTNSNFNAYVESVTKTGVTISLSAAAPVDLTVNVHAISRL